MPVNHNDNELFMYCDPIQKESSSLKTSLLIEEENIPLKAEVRIEKRSKLQNKRDHNTAVNHTGNEFVMGRDPSQKLIGSKLTPAIKLIQKDEQSEACNDESSGNRSLFIKENIPVGVEIKERMLEPIINERNEKRSKLEGIGE